MYWIAFLVPVMIIVAGLIFVVARGRTVVPTSMSEEVTGAVESGWRRSRRRLMLSLLLVPSVGGAVAAAIIASYQDADSVDGPLSRTSFLMIAPLIITIVTVLAVAFVPKYAEQSSRRSAELHRRSPLTFASRRAFTALVAMSISLGTVTVVFGLMAWPNRESLFYFYGRSRAGGGGGEFPGFGYGVPMLVSLAVLAAAVWLSLYRIAGAPRPTHNDLREADRAVRTTTTATITAMASFAVALSLGIVVLMASVAFWDVASGNSFDRAGNPVPVNSTAQLLSVLSHAGAGVGMGCLILAIYFLVHAISFAAATTTATARPVATTNRVTS